MNWNRIPGRFEYPADAPRRKRRVATAAPQSTRAGVQSTHVGGMSRHARVHHLQDRFGLGAGEAERQVEAWDRWSLEVLGGITSGLDRKDG